MHSQDALYQSAFTTYIMHNMHALIFTHKQLSAGADHGTLDSARAHVVNHGQQKDWESELSPDTGSRALEGAIQHS